jgi:peptidase A4-like protein
MRSHLKNGLREYRSVVPSFVSRLRPSFCTRPVVPRFSRSPTGNVMSSNFEPLSGIWSGVVLGAEAPAAFGSVQAVWQLPALGVPPLARPFLGKWKWNDQYEIDHWVGFGGNALDGSVLFQGGYGTFGYVNDKSLPTCYAWWYVEGGNRPYITDYILKGSPPMLEQVSSPVIPSLSVALNNISNFPVYPGDYVSMKLERVSETVFPGYEQLGILGAMQLTYVNFTRGLSTTFTLGATASLPGLSVEWIVETPTESPGLAADFGAVYFDKASCTFGMHPAGPLGPFPDVVGVGDAVAQSELGIRFSPQVVTTLANQVSSQVHSGETFGAPVILDDQLMRVSYYLQTNAWGAPP